MAAGINVSGIKEENLCVMACNIERESGSISWHQHRSMSACQLIIMAKWHQHHSGSIEESNGGGMARNGERKHQQRKKWHQRNSIVAKQRGSENSIGENALMASKKHRRNQPQRRKIKQRIMA